MMHWQCRCVPHQPLHLSQGVLEPVTDLFHLAHLVDTFLSCRIPGKKGTIWEGTLHAAFLYNKGHSKPQLMPMRSKHYMPDLNVWQASQGCLFISFNSVLHISEWAAVRV